tara:strand:- start:76 stop:837 length:762 start_codon:yes stop_codon:yes gene_type:complete
MEPKTRLAGQIFDEDNKLNLAGQEVLDYVSKRTGGQSTVKPLTRDNPAYRPGTGGYVAFKDLSTAFVNPEIKQQDYVLAHELAHSQGMTPVGKKRMGNFLQYGSAYDADKRPSIEGYNRFAGATLRHMFESETAPTMIEEANAQGVAVGAMQGLGRSTKDPFYTDPRNYPYSIGRGELDNTDARLGTFIEQERDPYTGADLGVKDEYGDTTYPRMSVPASIHSEDVSRTLDGIVKNIPTRINRQYRLGIDSMK